MRWNMWYRLRHRLFWQDVKCEHEHNCLCLTTAEKRERERLCKYFMTVFVLPSYGATICCSPPPKLTMNQLAAAKTAPTQQQQQQPPTQGPPQPSSLLDSALIPTSVLAPVSSSSQNSIHPVTNNSTDSVLQPVTSLMDKDSQDTGFSPMVSAPLPTPPTTLELLPLTDVFVALETVKPGMVLSQCHSLISLQTLKGKFLLCPKYRGRWWVTGYHLLFTHEQW